MLADHNNPLRIAKNKEAMSPLLSEDCQQKTYADFYIPNQCNNCIRFACLRVDIFDMLPI